MTFLQVNGIILENGADRDVAAAASAVAELQFEDEDDEAYYNKVVIGIYSPPSGMLSLLAKLAACDFFPVKKWRFSWIQNSQSKSAFLILSLDA